jgi:hypothetical protein
MSADQASVRLAAELQAVLGEAPIDLARAALVIAKLEYPGLDPQPSLDELARLGDRARRHLARIPAGSGRDGIAALNQVLFDEERFAGNRAHYDDFRNSLLNVVLERRLGIPITLGLASPSPGLRFPDTSSCRRRPIRSATRSFSIRSAAASSWTMPRAARCSRRGWDPRCRTIECCCSRARRGSSSRAS